MKIDTKRNHTLTQASQSCNKNGYTHVFGPSKYYMGQSRKIYMSIICGSHVRGIHLSLKYRSHETILYKNFPGRTKDLA